MRKNLPIIVTSVYSGNNRITVWKLKGLNIPYCFAYPYLLKNIEKQLIHNQLPYFHLYTSYACLGLYLPYGKTHVRYNEFKFRNTHREYCQNDGARLYIQYSNLRIGDRQ